jgi:hypothetical protein
VGSEKVEELEKLKSTTSLIRTNGCDTNVPGFSCESRREARVSPAAKRWAARWQ